MPLADFFQRAEKAFYKVLRLVVVVDKVHHAVAVNPIGLAVVETADVFATAQSAKDVFVAHCGTAKILLSHADFVEFFAVVVQLARVHRAFHVLHRAETVAGRSFAKLALIGRKIPRARGVCAVLVKHDVVGA